MLGGEHFTFLSHNLKLEKNEIKIELGKHANHLRIPLLLLVMLLLQFERGGLGLVMPWGWGWNLTDHIHSYICVVWGIRLLFFNYPFFDLCFLFLPLGNVGSIFLLWSWDYHQSPTYGILYLMTT